MFIVTQTDLLSSAVKLHLQKKRNNYMLLLTWGFIETLETGNQQQSEKFRMEWNPLVDQ